MSQVVVFVVLVGAALAIAAVADQRRGPAPTRTGYAVPQQLDRHDFVRPDAPWLVVLFSSASCRSCAEARALVEPLAGDGVAVHEVDVETGKDLHERYAIEAVPTLVIADADGAVLAQFVGPPIEADLRATLADLREIGPAPPGRDPGTGEDA